VTKQAIIFSLLAILLTGCDHSRSVDSLFGSPTLKIDEAVCAGKTNLTQGSATVRDGCFTGDTNVVVCTDESSVNAVRCKAARAALTVEGAGNDVISYARIR
jgi:hypothetical protein